MDKIHIQKLKTAGLVVLLLAAWLSPAGAQSFTVSPQLPYPHERLRRHQLRRSGRRHLHEHAVAINAAILDACVTNAGGTVGDPLRARARRTSS